MANLLIDDACRRVRKRLLVAHVASEEYLLLGLTILERSKLLRHTPVADHFARDIGRTLDVVASACRHAIEDDLLRSATAQCIRNDSFEILFRICMLLIDRQIMRHTESASTRNDRDLM